MAITITQERKKQRYFILVLALIISSVLFVVWRGFLHGAKTAPSVEVVSSLIYTFPQVKIDWHLLENIRLETLQPFEEIPSFEGEFGRENPFISY